MNDKEVRQYFTNTIAQDLFDLVAPECIAIGSTRTVFRANSKQVFKFETNAKRFQNIIEWETWEIVKHTKFAKWFAPCIDISNNGAILAQEFCRDLEDSELPEEVPVFLCDIKRSNFGMLDGNVVCRDYGNNYLIDRGFNTKKMKKAEW